ncbi:MAG: sigma-70 family RNA polymerase sigma factor [Pseudomonadota bacterium]
MMRAKRPNSAEDASALFDQYLVVLAQSGDREAGERLARRWHPRLARAARRYVGDAHAAEGLAQECWLAIARGIQGLRDPARFAPWAFGILRRKGADEIASNMRQRTAFADVEAPERAIEAAQEDKAAIAQAFARLAPDQRFAAHLHFVEGLTLREIAEAADIPLGTAKSRLFHARRQLKAALNPDFKGEDQ